MRDRYFNPDLLTAAKQREIDRLRRKAVNVQEQLDSTNTILLNVYLELSKNPSTTGVDLVNAVDGFKEWVELHITEINKEEG
jgi:hypothetical protein